MRFRDVLRDNYTTIATVLAIVAAIGLRFAGRLTDAQTISWLLGAVGGLAISGLIASLKNDKNIQTIMAHLHPKSVSHKTSRKEHYKLLNSMIINANSRIWIMTIDKALTSKIISTIPERSIYYQAVESVIKAKPNVVVRRIYGLPTNAEGRKNKINWIRDDIKKFEDCPNYHVRIFDWRKFKSIPAPLSLQIVDNMFVGIVNIQDEAGVTGGGEDICIEDMNIVQHLSQYYEAVWIKCDELKMGDDIKTDFLNRLA